MKKLLCMTFGLALMALALVPFSNASRDAYHTYLMGQPDIKRSSYYSGGQVRSTRLRATSTGKKYATYRTKNRAYRATRAVRQNYYITSTRRPDVRENRPSRTFSTTLRAPWKPVKSHVSRTNTYIQKFDYETYRNTEFSLRLPVGYIANEEGDHSFSFDNGNLGITIKKINNQVCAPSYGFTECAIQIARSENYKAVPGRGKITILDRVIRRAGKSDTVLNNLSTQAPTYTEQFSGYFLNGEVYTVSRYMVKSQNGEVYIIETKVARDDVSKYTGINKQIFDSFRIYGAELTE